MTMKEFVSVWTLKQGILHEEKNNNKKNDVIDGYELLQNVCKSQNIVNSPTHMFLTTPNVFFEIYWPTLRNWLHRQIFELDFENPLRLSQELKFEFIVPSEEKIPDYLFICGLSDYIPKLEIKLKDEVQFIIKVDHITRLVEEKIREVDLSSYKKILKNLNDKQNIQDPEQFLRVVIKNIIKNEIPLFIFIADKLLPKDICVLTITCVGNPFKFYNDKELLNFEKKFLSNYEIHLPTGSTYKKGKSKIVWKKILEFFRYIFVFAPVCEPQFFMELFAKNPPGSLWLFIKAPEKFHIELNEDDVSTSNKLIKKNLISKEDPEIASLRLGTNMPLEKSWQARLSFKTKIPKNHIIWLRLLNFISVILIFIWCFAILNFYGFLTQIPFLGNFIEKSVIIANEGEFFSATITFISFLMIAREWLIYEKTVFKLVSKRFALLFFILVSLSLYYVIFC
ncbi:hypothetical protein DSAG12_00715 [Promethearchaeum syntrophicum]|uniref:Uncharacterized protein n=1 Tax=Promethearchaeum syntrophicum TaxID=2594042 RepID=A0A5B9D6Z4_9ARCH|nr:hypothetical protein [Candidatus Prometheoarchaeum syntrophicum]QEE14894.1 hypothetical protein DSAG12_00715 [Candidatus Prometheoarchaeum syntrophicum]